MPSRLFYASTREKRKILAYKAFLFIAKGKTKGSAQRLIQRKFEAKEGKEGRNQKESKEPGRKERNRKQGPKKKNKKRFDPQSAKRFECFQAGKEASQ